MDFKADNLRPKSGDLACLNEVDYDGVVFQIVLALGNIVCKLSNIVIIKMYDVTCKLKDPRFNT